jgi:hypothetical protein
MGGLIGLVVTICHAILCLFVTYGVLFTRTPEGAFFNLVFLIVIFLMIRKFNGCVVTHAENPVSISTMGLAFLVKDGGIPIPVFEEIGVGVCLILQVIRLLTLLLIPSDMVLE